MTAYVPILATDVSRLAGLAATPDAVKARLTPLFDVTPPPRGRGLDAHLDALVDAVAGAFGARAALVDARDAGSERVDDCARTADGRVHLAYLLDAARARGLALVPVTGLGRPAAYQLAVADAVQVDGRGVALRLQRPDFRDPATLAARALAALDAIGAEPGAVDLLLDFGGITAGHLAAYEATARAVVAALAGEVGWRSVTIIAATQLLAGARGLDLGPRTVPRTDWLLWRALTAGAGAAPALDRYARAGALRFGDYGPLLYGPHPVRADGTAEWVGYAHGAEWLVRDVVGESHRCDIPRHDAPRAGSHWEGRRAVRVCRESPAPVHADVLGEVPWLEPPPPEAWPGPTVPSHGGPAGASNGTANAPAHAAELRRGTAERVTWRAAAVTHHLTVAVEQLAPSPRLVCGAEDGV